MNYLDELKSIQPKSILYHYTNQSGLLGIIKNKNLWCTNIHYLNDEKEIQHAIDLARGRLEKLSKSYDNNLRIYYEELSKSLHHIEKASIYVFSLTENGDHLSQWRAYTNPGDSYSIGFDISKLKNNFYFKRDFSLIPCVYKIEEQYKLIDELIHGFKITSEKDYNSINVRERERIYVTFATSFLSIAPIIKHRAYSEEKEWRLISTLISRLDDNIDFREGNNVIIPYYKLDLSGDIQAIVKELVIGPSPIKDLSLNSASSLLSNHGINKRTIWVSQIPFRQL